MFVYLFLFLGQRFPVVAWWRDILPMSLITRVGRFTMLYCISNHFVLFWDSNAICLVDIEEFSIIISVLHWQPSNIKLTVLFWLDLDLNIVGQTSTPLMIPNITLEKTLICDLEFYSSNVLYISSFFSRQKCPSDCLILLSNDWTWAKYFN